MILLLCLLTFAFACPTFSSTGAAPLLARLTNSTWTNVSSILDDSFAQLKLFGGSCMIAHVFTSEGASRTMTRGRCPLQAQPMKTFVPNEDSVWRIGSITKLFPSLLLYMAIERGDVQSLNARVNDALRIGRCSQALKVMNRFAPNNSFSSSSSEMYSDFTWQQLISHMAGLSREPPCAKLAPCSLNTSQVLDVLFNSSQTINYPGSEPRYSNLNFALIGRLVSECIDSLEFNDDASVRILKPLNMTSTFLSTPPTSVLEDRMVAGMVGTAVAPLLSFGWSAPAGEAFSTITDLRLLLMHFIDAFHGRLKSQKLSKLLKDSFIPRFTNQDELQTGWASPWELSSVATDSGALIRTASKGGNVNGYSAVVSTIPELESGIIVLFNAQIDESSVARRMWSTLAEPLNSSIPRHSLPPLPLNSTILNATIGEYGYPGYSLKIKVVENSIFLLHGTNFVYSQGMGFLHFRFVDNEQRYAYQLKLISWTLPCFSFDGAWEGEWVYVTSDGATLTAPGFLSTIPFPKRQPSSSHGRKFESSEIVKSTSTFNYFDWMYSRFKVGVVGFFI